MDPNNSPEKRNQILEINIFPNMYVTELEFVNGSLVVCLLDNYWGFNIY